MKEYLKMVDVFLDEMRVIGDSKNMLADDVGIIIGCYSGDKMAEYVLHAINSHDELVQMNQELLAALELMLLIHDEPSGFCGKFGKELDMAIEGQKEKIDTRIAVARNAIAKAKDAS